MAKLNFPLCLAVSSGWYIMCMLLNLGCVSAVDDIGPDAEESEALEEFLTKLERYSGLSPLNEAKRFLVKNVNCETADCIINVNGSLVWDVREKLYEQYMASSRSSPEDAENTLDGCLNTTSTSTYNECMRKLRNEMVTFLDEHFEHEFKTALEVDCNTTENCITAQNS
ncbi:uncharacterized protein [Euwallacea fornicatus]|uniref:uncharacterized protein n=1 Tax=Euwallacea fornicatus TaxID=995702 RepID=UPI0033904C1F